MPRSRINHRARDCVEVAALNFIEELKDKPFVVFEISEFQEAKLFESLMRHFQSNQLRGYKGSPRLINIHRLARIVSMTEAGVDSAELAQEYGCTRRTIARTLQSYRHWKSHPISQFLIKNPRKFYKGAADLTKRFNLTRSQYRNYIDYTKNKLPELVQAFRRQGSVESLELSWMTPINIDNYRIVKPELKII